MAGSVLAAHDERELGAGRGEGRLDIAHGDRAADGRAEAARGDDADRAAAEIADLRAVAGRRPALGARPTRSRAGPSRELAGDAIGAGEAALGAAALGDGEAEIGLDRRGGLVDVVAIEAEAGLEPERIARAEPDRLHLRLGEERPGEGLGMVGGDRDLEAVLAGVAGAGDVAVGAVERGARGAHEGEARRRRGNGGR